MQNIHLDFEKARIKHLLFKSKLRSLLYGAVEDDKPIISHTDCAVGQWIYTHALGAYGHIPEMLELEKVHTEIHTVARQLVKLYKEGKVSAARVGLSNIDNIADKLIKLLSNIEKKVENSTPLETTPHLNTDESYLKELDALASANKALDEVIQQQSGKLLQERQMLYEVLMQLPATIAILQGPDHVFEFANPSFLAGFPDKNILGKTVKEVLPSLEGQGFFELVDKVFHTGEPFNGKALPITVTSEDGTAVVGYIDLNYQALRDEAGKIDGVISFSYDVTEAVVARKNAQESEERLKFMSDAMPVHTWTSNSNGELEYVNQQWEAYFGNSAAEFMQKGWDNNVFAEDLPVVKEKWQVCIQDLTPFEVELRLKNKEGIYRWHLVRANAYRNADGKVKWFGTSTDIHEMKGLQEKLKQSYEDLEIKVKFRNLELERANKELQNRLDELNR